MSPQPLTSLHELDSRMNDGIHVRLLWCESENWVAVAVNDTRNGEAFCVEVREGERALEVFRHPYAYAAHHGVDTSAHLRGGALDALLTA